VSFLVVSVAALVESAFLVVSTTVVLVESTVLVESVVVLEELPLQAAAETAIAKAKKPNLNEFFILICLFIVLQLIQEISKGNPSFFKFYILSMWLVVYDIKRQPDKGLPY
jgi:hypothetical protein